MTVERREFLETLRKWEPYQLDGSLTALVFELKMAEEEALEKGWFNVHVYVDHYYEDLTIYVRAWRYETDEELVKRLQQEQDRLAAKKNRQQKKLEREAKKLAQAEAEERELYERLRKKFG
jgi:hypothetical protein